MTAPSGPILFNSSTGSDSAASGLGPATAVTGAGASTTAASAVVTGIDTTGVSAGDLLWVLSSSGRQFSIIASVDSGTQVTCDDNFANTESSRTWAIGGKRATLDDADSRRLFSDDAKSDWLVEPEDNQTITSQLTIGAQMLGLAGPEGTIPVINCTANAPVFGLTAPVERMLRLKLTNSNVTKTSAIGIARFTGGTLGWLSEVVFGDATNQLLTSCSDQISPNFFFCVFQNCTADGNDLGADGQNPSFFGCTIRDNGANGVEGRTTTANNRMSLINCLIYGNAEAGVRWRKALDGSLIQGCAIYDNGTDGVDASGSDAVLPGIVGNVIYKNGRYGINTVSEYSQNGLVYANAFGANTSGPRNNLAVAEGDITLTADPFVDAANEDFNINDTAGGGALLRAATVTLA